MKGFIIITAIVSLALAAENEMKIEGGKYNFAYSTGDVGEHKREESSDGAGSVSGSYSYKDPNGNLRTIQYKAGAGTGFQASGDIGVDKKTAEEAAKLAALAPKAPETKTDALAIPHFPFTYFHHPGLVLSPSLVHPLAYGYPHDAFLARTIFY